MDTVFKVGYSFVVAILLVLVVILGTRTFYSEPISGSGYSPAGAQGYNDDRDDYFRNVFILANVLGVAAVAVGLYLFRRVEAMPLGLLLGGVGVVIYGWVESARGPGETSTAPLFAVVAAGLADGPVQRVAAPGWTRGARAQGDGRALVCGARRGLVRGEGGNRAEARCYAKWSAGPCQGIDLALCSMARCVGP